MKFSTYGSYSTRSQTHSPITGCFVPTVLAPTHGNYANSGMHSIGVVERLGTCPALADPLSQKNPSKTDYPLTLV